MSIIADSVILGVATILLVWLMAARKPKDQTITLSWNKETANRIKRLKQLEETGSTAELFRRSLCTHAFFMEEMSKGATVVLEYKDGKTVKVNLLYSGPETVE